MEKDIIVNFTDTMVYDAQNKNVVSIRDGFQEYLGIELNLQPFDKVFKICRDKDDIRALADKLVNLPITDNHIEPEGAVEKEFIRGFIDTSEAVDHRDVDTDTHVIIRNGIRISDNMVQLVHNGKKELSLGYKAKLIPHAEYDFQQVEIVPHHLAIVDKGRCGEICKFTDGETMLKQFMDENGAVSLERVMELVQQLPEVINKMDIKELGKLVPILQKVMTSAGMDEVTEPEPVIEPTPNGEEEVMDMDKEEVATKAVEEFKDSKCFLDAQLGFADERVDCIEKAKTFLDAEYVFKGKSNNEIMQDVLKAEKPSESFKDNEISVAFKMLASKEVVKDYQNFGDNKPVSKWKQAESEEV